MRAGLRHRIAAVGAGLIFSVLLLLGAYITGTLTHTPQITYSGILDEKIHVLFAYDMDRDLSMPLHGTESLMVAWSWSPDGRQIAYVLLNGTNNEYEIVLWTPELRRGVKIADRLPFGSPPQWSPDGTGIAAIDSRQDICIYYLDLRPPRCLNVQPAGQPSWSPDGTAIAYISRLPEGGLVRVNIADGKLTPLFTGVSGLNHPRWSPDGHLIAFSYQRQNDVARHIYAMPENGGELRALTDGDSWQDQPVWSPDSRYLAFNEYPDVSFSQSDIAILEVESGSIIKVTTHPMVDSEPRWSPDGRYLAFVSNRFDSKPSLHIIPSHRLDQAEPLANTGIALLLYAYAWRP